MVSEAQGDDWDPKKAFDKVSASLEQPDKFAEIFCKAASSQKSIDKVLTDNFKSLLQNDNDVRCQIKGLLREVDKEDWRSFIRKIGTPAWAVILVVVGAILQALSRKYFG